MWRVPFAHAHTHTHTHTHTLGEGRVRAMRHEALCPWRSLGLARRTAACNTSRVVCSNINPTHPVDPQRLKALSSPQLLCFTQPPSPTPGCRSTLPLVGLRRDACARACARACACARAAARLSARIPIFLLIIFGCLGGTWPSFRQCLVFLFAASALRPRSLICN